MNEIDKLLFDDSSSHDDSLLTVFTDNFKSVYFQVKSDSGCEVTRLDRDKLWELKRAIDAHLGVNNKVLPLSRNSAEIELEAKPHPCIPNWPLQHKFKVCDITNIQIWCWENKPSRMRKSCTANQERQTSISSRKPLQKR